MTNVLGTPDLASTGSALSIFSAAKPASPIFWALAAGGAGSRQWCELTGQAPQQLDDGGWLHAIHPDDQLRVHAVWTGAVDLRQPFEVRHRLRCADGTYRLFRMQGVLTDHSVQPAQWTIIHTDLTQQPPSADDLCDDDASFALATRASTDGVWDIDCVSDRAYFSASFQRILGLPDQATFGSAKDWFSRIHPYDAGRVLLQREAAKVIRELRFQSEFRCRHEDGSWRWLLTQALCQRSPDGTLLRATGSVRDVTESKVTDSLTGLHNRISLLEHVQWRIDHQAERQVGFGLLFIDLDFFKRINDSMGHLKGDALLVEVGRRLAQAVEQVPGSIVSRLGGDEFAVLMDEVATEDDALAYAARLSHLLELPMTCLGQQVFISASIGVAVGAPGVYDRAAQVLEDADIAMYRAKVNGKAQSAVFTQRMRREAIERLALESDLRNAIHRDEFELFYQPKIILATGQIKGFEALLRWHQPKRGMVSPADFIPLAEETGLIKEIGRWVAARAIRQLALWRSSGVVDSRTTMAVNISSREFNEPDLLDFFKGQLEKTDLPPECLVLEVTESVLVEDSPAALALLQSIVAAGIGLDLDDFGTGYSSLSYLHRFPFRCVKIDQAFVRLMSTEPQSISLVSAIVALAGALRMGVIAEGVETEEQATHLRRMGCGFAQGYLFSRPLPASEIEVIMAAERKLSSQEQFAPSIARDRAAAASNWTEQLELVVSAIVNY